MTETLKLYFFVFSSSVHYNTVTKAGHVRDITSGPQYLPTQGTNAGPGGNIASGPQYLPTQGTKAGPGGVRFPIKTISIIVRLEWNLIGNEIIKLSPWGSYWCKNGSGSILFLEC